MIHIYLHFLLADRDAVSNDCATYRQVCWDVNSRGAVGESLLLLCFLNATKSHYDLAKRLLSIYPCMINDIYLNDEYYGM